MPRDKTDTHKKVLAAAKEEFSEYGFEKASMRRIGERCGLTAAGLYRHCKDKSDLFDQIVGPAVEEMERWIDEHVEQSRKNLDDPDALFRDTEIDMVEELVFPHMDDYRILLTGAQGTRYENFLHDLVESQAEITGSFIDAMELRGYPVKRVSDNEMHLLLSAYVTALFEPVIHGFTLDEAMRCLRTVEAFFMPGWKMLMGCDDQLVTEKSL